MAAFDHGLLRLGYTTRTFRSFLGLSLALRWRWLCSTTPLLVHATRLHISRVKASGIIHSRWHVYSSVPKRTTLHGFHIPAFVGVNTCACQSFPRGRLRHALRHRRAHG